LVFLVVLLAVICAAVDWISGKSLASYEEELAFYIGLGFLFWFLTPFYYEFQIRTKEIDGKVSAIEEAVTSAKEDRAELLERLVAIEAKLDDIQRDAGGRIEPAR
jgi:F0F1-type ATP synthase membrane subunit b/b'